MNVYLIKEEFETELRKLLLTFENGVSTNKQWNVKGFVDVYEKIFTISSDTKVISKVMELQIYPFLKAFAEEMGYSLILPDKQNWYPDMTFVNKTNEDVKFAVDFKTTYRENDSSDFCNGFTLGSHGKYFKDRSSNKNIQFPYEMYTAHYCLGVIYSRVDSVNEQKKYELSELKNIPSVICNFIFFLQEKWKIASDKPGSGNTANIGSITYIPDILAGRGIFADLGEEIFDDYWINYGNIEIFTKVKGKRKKKKVTSLVEYAQYRKIKLSETTKRILKKDVK